MSVAVVSGVLGIAAAYWGVPALVGLAGSALPRGTAVSLNTTVLAFAVALSMATGIASGLVPALLVSRQDAVAALRTNAAVGSHARFRAALVVAEVALATTLLAGAGLLLRSFDRLSAVDPGFQPYGALVLSLSRPENGAAEFFALDLPTNKSGARAVHLFGTITTQGRKDIVVRLFKSSDYDNWLKQKSGRKPLALWTSPRSGNLTLDQDLPAGTPIVLLLDNGYSIRTPKKVNCQLQLRYERNGTETFDTEGSKKVAGTTGDKKAAPEDNLPPPRSNTDEEMPPPPPPPPSGY